MDVAVIVAVITAFSSLVVAIVGAVIARKNQRDFEVLRGQLEEEKKEKDAWRDYQYEARKRLYHECEPILFLLAEVSEKALGRIYGLVRSARNGNLCRTAEGWLSSDNYYYFTSTMYRLLAPTAVFKLLRRQLTSVDLTVDQRIKAQYEIAKLLYRSFSDDYQFAGIEPRLEYDPNHEEWQERSRERPDVYWRQGIIWGRLDNAIDALTAPDAAGNPQLMSYGHFEAAYLEQRSELRNQFELVILPLLRFHPKTRPVFWRMLVTQAHLYDTLLRAHGAAASDEATDRVLDLVRDLKRERFDWRGNPSEATDEEVLVQPFTVTRAYLETHLENVEDVKESG